jgi:hypothetical protein
MHAFRKLKALKDKLIVKEASLEESKEHIRLTVRQKWRDSYSNTTTITVVFNSKRENVSPENEV